MANPPPLGGELAKITHEAALEHFYDAGAVLPSRAKAAQTAEAVQEAEEDQEDQEDRFCRVPGYRGMRGFNMQVSPFARACMH